MNQAKLHRYNALNYSAHSGDQSYIDHNGKTRILLRIYTYTYTFMHHYVIAWYTIIDIHNSVLDYWTQKMHQSSLHNCIIPILRLNRERYVFELCFKHFYQQMCPQL